MMNYVKPEVELVEFAMEAITDGSGVTGTVPGAGEELP